jgi:hypothetical protein
VRVAVQPPPATGLSARRAPLVAAAMLQQYEGAVLLGRTHRSVEPLRTAARVVGELLTALER